MSIEPKLDDHGKVRFCDPVTDEEFFVADRKIHPWRWRALTLWIIIFSLAVGYSVRVGREQDNAIQASRLHSCQATYEGIREVFKPFFTPPAQQTAKQKADQKKFNQIIDKRKRSCARVVKTKD